MTHEDSTIHAADEVVEPEDDALAVTPARSLQRRFVASLTAAAVLLAAVAAALGWRYAEQAALQRADATLQGLVDSLAKTASIGAYAADKVLLQELADGLARHPAIAHARFVDAAGQTLVADAADAAHRARPAAAAGAAPRDAAPAEASRGAGARVVALASPFDAREVVGHLHLEPDAVAIRAEATREAGMLAAALAGLVLALAAVAHRLTVALLARPLRDVAQQLATMKAGTDERLSLDARHDGDELGTVLKIANRLLDANARALSRERQMRAEIAAMEAQYRQIFDFTSAGIFVVTTEGRLVNSNPTVSRVIGATTAQMQHLRGVDFIGMVFADPLRVRTMIAQASDAGETVSTDLQVRRLDGTTCWVHCLISVQATEANADAGETLVEGVIYDVTQRRRAETAARHRADHDPLTGLKNRGAVERALDAAVRQARLSRSALTTLYIDLDGFKQVNDRHGHEAGDAVLVECATRLRALTRRSTDIVGRLGGDELVVLVDGADVREGTVADLAARIVDKLSLPIAIGGGREVTVGASVGAASFPRHATDAVQLLRAADAAMYEVKRNGRHGWRSADGIDLASLPPPPAAQRRDDPHATAPLPLDLV